MKAIISCILLMASIYSVRSELSCYSYNEENLKSERIQLPDITTSKSFSFKRAGKGTFRFFIEPFNQPNAYFTIQLGPLVIEFYYDDVSIENSETYQFKRHQLVSPLPVNLINFNASSLSIWVSFYSGSVNFEEPCFIKIGYGYVMEANTLINFTSMLNATKSMMAEITDVDLGDKLTLSTPCTRYDKEALIADSPPIISIFDQTVLDDLESNLVTYAELPMESQVLYSKVAGPSVRLTDEQIDAINYSLDNPNCCLHEILKDKDINKPGFGYIRVTFPNKFGDSPGHPYVLEIWPKQHQSPIHNHGNTVAIIKLLHGRLKSEYFNPLSKMSYEKEQIRPIHVAYFNKGQITWMTPDIYQTHRLINENNDTAAISIQAYSHLDSELFLEEKFNYLENNFPADPHLKSFFPKKDLFYADLINSVTREYRDKRCYACLNGSALTTTKSSTATTKVMTGATGVSMTTASTNTKVTGSSSTLTLNPIFYVLLFISSICNNAFFKIILHY